MSRRDPLCPRANAGDLARRAAGFTLVELMVALLVSAIVMYGVYFIYERSSSAFRVENQVADMLQQHRFALQHLKRDLNRAGFQATTNSTADPSVCFNPTGQPLRALTVTQPPRSEGVWIPAGSPNPNPNITPVSFTVLGDFWTRGPFLVHSVAGNRLELVGNSYYDENGNGVDDPGDLPTNAELADWFRANRLLRLVNDEGRELYFHISSFARTGGGVDGTWPVVILREAVPAVWDGSGCGVRGLGTGVQVNPVGYLRYRIARDQRGGAPPWKFDLVREELNPDNLSQPLPQTQLVIAENAVDLQLYDFVFDMGTRRTPQLSYANPFVEGVITANLLDAVNAAAAPQRLRAVTVRLSVRSPDEDPKHPFRPRRVARQPFDSYELNPDLPGSARVMTGGGRVVLDNFLVRNLLP